jgi:hypothetical protein
MSLLRILSCVAALVLLAGCPTTLQRPLPEANYTSLAPIALDVATIQIVDETKPPPPGWPPAGTVVTDSAPLTPAAAAAQLGHDRLRAAGANGTAKLAVVEAWIVEVPLPRTQGIEGVFTQDQAARYDAAVEVRLDVSNAGGQRSATLSARAEGNQTIPEDITLNERQRVLWTLVDGLTRSLSAELDRSVAEHLGAFRR